MSGSKAAALGVIGIILGAGGLGLGLLSTINFQILGSAVSDDKWYYPFYVNGGNDAIVTMVGWLRSPAQDDDAWFRALFIIPQTRNDWKVCIIHLLTITTGSISALSGTITMGAVGNGDDNSYFNIFSGENFDLTIPMDDKIYHTYSSAFNASAGDRLYAQWSKDDSPTGTGFIYINLALVHG